MLRCRILNIAAFIKKFWQISKLKALPRCVLFAVFLVNEF